MEDLLERLPELNLASDEDSDDGDIQVFGVFSRSAHLKSLGMEGVAIETDSVVSPGPLKNVPLLETSTRALEGRGQKKECSSEELSLGNGPSHSVCVTEAPPVGPQHTLASEDNQLKERAAVDEDSSTVNSDTEIDWTKFKSDFSDSLLASEERIASGEQELPLTDIKQQLLFDAILAMHNNPADPYTDDTNQQSDPSNKMEGSGSPSKTRRSLLSLNTLETIHESELDRMLETDTSTTQTSSLSDSSLVNQPPVSKLVWDKEDTGQLMKDLEHLSKTGTNGVRYSESTNGGWSKPGNALASPRRTQNGGKKDGPVFLDLRPTQDKQEEGSIGQDRQSTSEDDESDDPYTWISQRKQIKHGLHTSLSPATPPSHTHTSHSHSRYTTRSKDSLPLLKTQNDSYSQENLSSTVSSKQSKDLETTERKCGLLPSKKMSHTESQTVNDTLSMPSASTVNTLTQNHVNSNYRPSEEAGFKKKRNTNSLSLSSSLSEEEAPSSEGAGVNKIESPASSPTKAAPASPTKGKNSSKKQAKKSKKSRKKDKEPTSKKDPGKISQRKLARALVLERIRNDSLTTSSDEEHCLTPTGSRTSELSSSASEASLACQEGEEDSLVTMDTGKLRLRLQKIIQSKKPPAQFVTPATSPVFHEEVSFGAQLNSTDPSRSTDALLVFPLSEDGLLFFPDEDESLELDTQTQLSFHLLILTWLINQAVVDHQVETVLTSNLEFVFDELEDGNLAVHEPKVNRSEFTDRPFWITGLQQTIHDGRPSLLVGISVLPHLKATITAPSDRNPFSVSPDSELIQNEDTISSKLMAYLHKTPLSDFVRPVLDDVEISSIIPSHSLEQLNEIVQLPLKSFFNVQDDVTSLTTPISFYWHSGYHISSMPTDESLKTQTPVSTTVCTLSEQSLTNCPLVFTTLHCVYHNALDLAGLRIVYGVKKEDSQVMPSKEKDDGKVTLALAIRAPDAVYRWLDVVGPEDSNLAKVTDPTSLVAKFGNSQYEALKCVRTPYLAMTTLSEWFGGRACLKSGSVLGISDSRTKLERRKRQRVRFSESESEDGLPSPALDVTFPPLISNRPCLIARPYTKTLLVVAPLVPPSLYGTVMSTCSRLGFDILGMKRIRLNSKRATALQISKLFMANFTPSSTPPSPAVMEFVTHPLSTERAQSSPPYPSVVLYLGAENSRLHSTPLRELICSDLSVTLEQNPLLNDNLRAQLNHPDSLLHTTEVSQETTKVLGNFSLSVSVSSTIPHLHDEKRGGTLNEELCFVAIPQCTSLPKLIGILNKVYRIKPAKKQQNGFASSFSDSRVVSVPDNDTEELGGFELLGLKVVPQISRFRAKRLCPLPSTESLYQQAVQLLSDVPATLLLFRGINCNQRLASLLADNQKTSRARSPLYRVALEQELEIIVSKNFEDAFNLASIFFSDKELFADSQSLGIASYLPTSWLQDTAILHNLQQPPEPLLSVATVCMSDMRLVVKVLDKLSRTGFSFVGMVTVELGRQESETFIEDLESGIVESDSTQCNGGPSEPGLVLCVQRVNAVWYLKYVLSPFVDQQKKTRKHTLSYSDSFSAAIADIKQYFPDGLCCMAGSITQEYKIDCDKKDVFGDMFLPDSCQPASNSSLFSFVSPLMETTGFVLPPSFIVQESRLTTPGFLEVVEFLSQAGFEVRGLKMVTLSKDIARELLIVCDSVDGTEAEDLCSGPSLALVVKRDNAASCCQMIFKSAVQSSYRRGPSTVSKLLSEMIVPGNAKQAKETLELFKTQQT